MEFLRMAHTHKKKLMRSSRRERQDLFFGVEIKHNFMWMCGGWDQSVFPFYGVLLNIQWLGTLETDDW